MNKKRKINTNIFVLICLKTPDVSDWFLGNQNLCQSLSMLYEYGPWIFNIVSINSQTIQDRIKPKNRFRPKNIIKFYASKIIDKYIKISSCICFSI